MFIAIALMAAISVVFAIALTPIALSGLKNTNTPVMQTTAVGTLVTFFSSTIGGVLTMIVVQLNAYALMPTVLYSSLGAASVFLITTIRLRAALKEPSEMTGTAV